LINRKFKNVYKIWNNSYHIQPRHEDQHKSFKS